MAFADSQEFYRKCFLAHESLTNQIDWAQAEANQSRERAMFEASMNGTDEGSGLTTEEMALGELFETHSALAEALKQHDDMERMAVDEMEMREVRERSKKDTKMERNVGINFRRHWNALICRVVKRQTSSLRDSTLEDLPLDRLRPSVMLSYRQRIIPLSRLLGQSIAPPCLFPTIISRIADHAHLLPTASLRAYTTPLIEPAHRLASPSWRKQEGHGHYPTPSAGRKMLQHRACQARQKKQIYSSQDRVLRSRTKVKWTQWTRTRMRVHRPNRLAKLWANDVSSKM